MDFDWFLKEFLLQVAVNLTCLAVLALCLLVYLECWVWPARAQARAASPLPDSATYEEELKKIRLDLASISTTYLMTKNMNKKRKSRVEEEVEEQEKIIEDAPPEEENNAEEGGAAETPEEAESEEAPKEDSAVIDIE